MAAATFAPMVSPATPFPKRFPARSSLTTSTIITRSVCDHGIRFEPKDANSQRADSGGNFGAIFSDLAGAQLATAEPSKEAGKPSKEAETRAAADSEKGSYEAGSDKRHEAAVKAAATRGAGKGDKQKSKESQERAERAKATYRVSDKLAQDQGDKRARDVATWTGMKLTGDNEPMDAVARTARGQMCGIEVKCLTRQSNDKITMHPESLARKNGWAKKNRASTFTVVIDDRDDFEGGKHADKYSGHQIYMQRGFGSFRLGSMVKIRDSMQLRDIIRGKKKISDVAEVSE